MSGYRADPYDLVRFERKVYSQFTECGLTLELVRRLTPPPFFVEIGAGDGLENNTRVLAEAGWGGVWYDPVLVSGNVPQHVFAISRKVQPDEMARFMPAVLGVLSIDVDGNDYWLWEAVVVQPSIVIIEAQVQRPEDVPYIMPFDPEYEWDQRSHDCGASVFSLVELGKKKGYTLVVRPSNPHSPNLMFVRDDLLPKLSSES